MLSWIKKTITQWWQDARREYQIPSPPFKASKRTATIMYGLWYGRISPSQARKIASEWGYDEDQIEEMITEATAGPSYWSQHSETEAGDSGE